MNGFHLFIFVEMEKQLSVIEIAFEITVQIHLHDLFLGLLLVYEFQSFLDLLDFGLFDCLPLGFSSFGVNLDVFGVFLENINS